MDNIGFKSSVKDDTYEGKTFEDYDHRVTLFGIPIFRSTKKHILDTHSKGKQ